MYSRRELGDRVPRVPRNYSGNAFREVVPPAPSEAVEVLEEHEMVEATAEEAAAELAPTGEESVPAARSGLFSHAGGLFGQGGSIGSEELLLLGLILLLSQNEKQDDLLPLLLLLLLIR